MNLSIFSCILVSILSFAHAVNQNPEGYAVFDPDLVWELQIDGNPTNNTLPSGAVIHYYWVTIPNAHAFKVKINVNTAGDGCDTNFAYTLNMANRVAPSKSPGWGCYDETIEANFCESDYDEYIFYTNYENEFSVGMDGYYPGGKFYMSLQEDDPFYNCDYQISVSSGQGLTCADDEVPFTTYNGDYLCEKYTTVKKSGVAQSGTVSESEHDIFRMYIPSNTARLRIKMETDSADTWQLVFSSGAVMEQYDWTISTSLENGNYVGYANLIEVPEGALYATIRPTVGNKGYTITFEWDVCDDDATGYDTQVDQPTSFYDGDCQDEKVDLQLPHNQDFPKTYTFEDVINTSDDMYYSGKMITIGIPEGTTGWLNITCQASDAAADTWIAASYGLSMPACNYNYNFWFSCSNYYMPVPFTVVLSQTLYGGPELQFIMCTASSDTPVDFTITMDGSLDVPELDSAHTTQAGLISLVILILALLF